MQRKTVFLLIWLALSVATTAEARTWLILPAGGGDFLTPQEAMAVCADGDTIRLGAGRFSGFAEVSIGGGWTAQAIIGITRNNLTFIGAGADQTIIGPAVAAVDIASTAQAVYSAGGHHARFLDIGFENVRILLRFYYGSLEVERCHFSGGEYGISGIGLGELTVRDSVFESDEIFGRGIIVTRGNPLLITGCRFESSTGHSGGISICCGAIGLASDCWFGTAIGLAISGVDTRLTIRDCVTSADCRAAVDVDSATIELINNELQGSFAGLSATGAAIVTGVGNVIAGGEETEETCAAIYLSPNAVVTLHGNEIIRRGEFAVRTGRYLLRDNVNDLSLNSWGTNDPDEVAEWIWDRNDDPLHGSWVTYLPLADSPVSIESNTWGGVKALYR